MSLNVCRIVKLMPYRFKIYVPCPIFKLSKTIQERSSIIQNPRVVVFFRAISQSDISLSNLILLYKVLSLKGRCIFQKGFAQFGII